MRVVGTFDAKTHLNELLRAVAQGETITITNRGKPVALLTPVRTPANHEESWKALRQLRAELPRISSDELCSWVDEGRR
jgi:prevent-host-death family protein